MPLGRSAVLAGTFANFYTYRKAEGELGYTPTKTFRQAVEEMYDYYKEKGYLGIKDRISLTESAPPKKG